MWLKRCSALTLALLALQAPAGAGQGTLVVLNKAEATASLIDIDSGRVVATVPTGKGPHEVDVSPDGKLAVATDYGTGEEPGSSLTVIEIPSARVVKTIDLGEYRRPHGIVWLEDGRTVVVTAEANKALLTVDVPTGKVTGSVPTGQEVSHMVVVTPDGRRAFVANIGSGSITVIDLKTKTHVKDVPTGAGAEGIAITPDGTEVWVTNRAEDTVTVLDASSLEIVKTMGSKSFPIRAKVTPDGKHALVSNARSGDVSVFSARSKEELRRVDMALTAEDLDGRLFGGQFGDSSVPIGILVRPDGKAAYVANANADLVSIIDLESWKTAGVLEAGKEPDGLGYSPLPVKPAAGKESE